MVGRRYGYVRQGCYFFRATQDHGRIGSSVVQTHWLTCCLPALCLAEVYIVQSGKIDEAEARDLQQVR